MSEPDFELEIGGHDPHSDAKTVRLKSWSNIIATIGALLIGFLAFFKPTDQAPTKAAYDELKRALEEESGRTKANHDDLVAMREYLNELAVGAAQDRDCPDLPPPSSSSLPLPFLAPMQSKPFKSLSAPPVVHPMPVQQQLPAYSDIGVGR